MPDNISRRGFSQCREAQLANAGLSERLLHFDVLSESHNVHLRPPSLQLTTCHLPLSEASV
ncbi:hypothetical protein J6590_052658 [Homalodisca vitripennis]|nr:hypothetical protein J6590_052658 [Homalodisca vitripennis]